MTREAIEYMYDLHEQVEKKKKIKAIAKKAWDTLGLTGVVITSLGVGYLIGINRG